MTFNIIHDGDCYEVLLTGHVVGRITRYLNGSSLRQELTYDHVPVEVQELILDKVSHTLRELQE